LHNPGSVFQGLNSLGEIAAAEGGWSSAEDFAVGQEFLGWTGTHSGALPSYHTNLGAINMGAIEYFWKCGRRFNQLREERITTSK